jgi:rod shape-determining protein MreC
MAVITPAGIVGKILRAYPTTAQVLEITDQTSGVGATLVKSRLQGILKGQPGGDPRLAYIMSDETIAPGEEVITSGGDRIFPKGLPIGKVVSASPGKDLFLNVSVTPSANLNRLEEVLVITKIEEREPDAEAQGPIRAADILAERLPSVPDKTGGTVPAGTVKPTAGAQAAPAAATSTQPAAKPGTASLAKPGSTTSATAGAATPRATPRPPAPKTASSGATPASNGNDSAPKPNGANGAGPKPASLAAKPPAAGATDKAGPEGSGPGKPEPSEAPAKPSPSATETRAPGAAKSVSDQGPNASGDSRSSPAAANGTP